MPGSCFLDELLRYLYLRKIGYVYSSSYSNVYGLK